MSGIVLNGRRGEDRGQPETEAVADVKKSSELITKGDIFSRLTTYPFSQLVSCENTLPRNFNSTALQRYSAIMSKLIKGPDLRFVNLLLTRLISSDAPFNKCTKPDGKWQEKVRKLYVTIALMVAAEEHDGHSPERKA